MVFALLTLLHFVLAAAIVYGLVQLSLIPWRQTRDAHWTVRARNLWPARASGFMLAILVPATLGAAQFYFLHDLPFVDLFAVLAGVVGALPALWPLSLAVFPELPFTRWLRDFLVVFIIRVLVFALWFTAAFCMPDHFGPLTIGLALAVVAFVVWLHLGGSLWLLRVTGFLAPATERFTGIVHEVAARMSVPVPRLGLLRTHVANALAYPISHTLLVTAGALAALPDDELAAVCAHEFAHLHEPRGVILARLLTAFLVLPMIFIAPAIAAWGMPGLFAICGAVIVLSRLTMIFRRRMEKRADSIATVHEGPSPGVYARALERLHEVNLVPAVIAGNITHPNLYDRLLAAGVTPAYPRPAAPPRISWQKGIMFLLFVASVTAVVLRMQQDDKKDRDALRTRHSQEDAR